MQIKKEDFSQTYENMVWTYTKIYENMKKN